MKTSKYRITDSAGPYVAGTRIAGITPDSAGTRTIDLTDDQASYELVTGAIESVLPKPVASSHKPKASE